MNRPRLRSSIDDQLRRLPSDLRGRIEPLLASDDAARPRAEEFVECYAIVVELMNSDFVEDAKSLGIGPDDYTDADLQDNTRAVTETAERFKIAAADLRSGRIGARAFIETVLQARGALAEKFALLEAMKERFRVNPPIALPRPGTK